MTIRTATSIVLATVIFGLGLIHLTTTPNGCYAGLFVIGDPMAVCQ